MAIITVSVDRVTNLANTDVIGKSDPYVKLELKQDNLLFDKKFGTKVTKTKNDDLNPVYNETFSFEVPSSLSLQNLVLICKVMDKDFLLDDKLGQCKIKLDDLPLTENLLGVERVLDKNLFTMDARIYLHLSYKL